MSLFCDCPFSSCHLGSLAPSLDHKNRWHKKNKSVPFLLSIIPPDLREKPRRPVNSDVRQSKKNMKSIISWLAAAASIAGLYFTVKPEQPLTQWQLFFLALISIVFIIAALVDLHNERKSLPKKYKNKAKINNYMFDMLKKSGACEICSRDASWITDDRIYPLLVEKSKNRELKLYVHTKTDEVNSLEQNGAEVIEYGKFGFEPFTRFTIVNSGNHASSYVAIGKQKPNEPHIIEELDSSHPTYSMAKDLIQSIKATNDNFKKI